MAQLETDIAQEDTAEHGGEQRPVDEPLEQELLVERGLWKFTPLLALAAGSRFALTLVLPAAVISGVIPPNVATILLAVIGYCLLVWDAVSGTIERVRLIYDPQVMFEPTIRARRTLAQWMLLAKATVTVELFKSYIYFAYAFALAYALLSRLDPEAFNARLGVGTAFYFSITTIATVGYGDILPVSSVARAMVVTEILLGLVYIVLVFSVVAGHLQKRSE